MHRFCILINLIVAFSCSGLSQTKSRNEVELDSLKKYSYFVWGLKIVGSTGRTAGGTGFFIRDKGALYFATAKHVLIGCNGYEEKETVYPDQMTVYANDEKKDGFDSILLDTKNARDTSTCYRLSDQPDIIVIKISSSQKIKPFSIEKFLKVSSSAKIKLISAYGFPNTKNQFYNHNLSNKKANFSITTFSIDSSKQYFVKNELVTDSVNFTLSNANVGFNESFHGYSGSPVFAQKEGANNWEFLGIFVAVKESKNFAFIAKRKYLLKNFQN